MTPFPPSPRPSPLGRGRAVRNPLDLRKPAAIRQSRKISQSRQLLFPLPAGEGQGEGKWGLKIIMLPALTKELAVIACDAGRWDTRRAIRLLFPFPEGEGKGGER